MIKSLKKKERSLIEISPLHFKEKIVESLNSLAINSEIDYSVISPSTRVFYEIEMLKFRTIDEVVRFNGITCYKNILSKGIGNICPWENYVAMIAIEVKLDNKLLYSNFIGLNNKKDEFIKNISNVRKEIKL